MKWPAGQEKRPYPQVLDGVYRRIDADSVFVQRSAVGFPAQPPASSSQYPASKSGSGMVGTQVAAKSVDHRNAGAVYLRDREQTKPFSHQVSDRAVSKRIGRGCRGQLRRKRCRFKRLLPCVMGPGTDVSAAEK